MQYFFQWTEPSCRIEKKCEGYFVYKNRYVVARNTGLGYVEFPGEGIDGNNPIDAMKRETQEETGAIMKTVALYKKVFFDWDPT